MATSGRFCGFILVSGMKPAEAARPTAESLLHEHGNVKLRVSASSAASGVDLDGLGWMAHVIVW